MIPNKNSSQRKHQPEFRSGRVSRSRSSGAEATGGWQSACSQAHHRDFGFSSDVHWHRFEADDSEQGSIRHCCGDPDDRDISLTVVNPRIDISGVARAGKMTVTMLVLVSKQERGYRRCQCPGRATSGRRSGNPRRQRRTSVKAKSRRDAYARHHVPLDHDGLLRKYFRRERSNMSTRAME